MEWQGQGQGRSEELPSGMTPWQTCSELFGDLTGIRKLQFFAATFRILCSWQLVLNSISPSQLLPVAQLFIGLF